MLSLGDKKSRPLHRDTRSVALQATNVAEDDPVDENISSPLSLGNYSPQTAMTDKNPAQEPDEDDFELELEPVDPEIESHQRRRAIEKTRAAEDSVDIDDLYHETNSSEPADPIDFGQFKKFQFSIQHLLIATALLSLVMTVVKLQGGCAAVAASIAASVAAGWWYVLRQERRQRAQKEVELTNFKAKIAAQRAKQDGQTVPLPASVEDADDDDDAEPRPAPRFDFSFSLKEMFGAFTVAAVMLGLVQILGGPLQAAMLLGLIALSGLVLHAVGFDPPRVVVLGWWLLLVLYLFISVWAAFGADQAAVPRPIESNLVDTLI